MTNEALEDIRRRISAVAPQECEDLLSYLEELRRHLALATKLLLKVHRNGNGVLESREVREHIRKACLLLGEEGRRILEDSEAELASQR